MNMADEVPYFIQMRGCINCEASRLMKERHGTDYGFDHEIAARCVLMGCVNYGRSILNPFIDPEELVRMANASGREDFRSNARRYCSKVKETLGGYYEAIGVSLDSVASKLTPETDV